jgi:ankyrin repeat protein
MEVDPYTGYTEPARSGCGRALLIVAIGVAICLVLLGAGCIALVGSLGDLELHLPNPTDDCTESHNRMISAAAKGRADVVAQELRGGTDPNLEVAGVTALFCASQASEVEAVTVLLDSGAQPQPDDVGAAVGTHSGILGLPDLSPAPSDPRRDQVVTLLLDHGADPNGGAKGPSPLLYAAWSGRRSLVDLLESRGADPNHGGRVPSVFITFVQTGALDSSSSTQPRNLLPEPRSDEIDNVPPLIGAAWQSQDEIATRLLDAGADPNLVSDEAFSAVYAAAVRGDRAMVELLLARGASPAPTVRAGVRTPAEAARAAGHPEIATLLEAPPPG